MKDSTKAIIIAGGIATVAYAILATQKAAAAEEPFKLVSFSAPDNGVAGETLAFSIVVYSKQARDIMFSGRFIKTVGTIFGQGDNVNVHLEAGQEREISFAFSLFPPDQSFWEWSIADPSRGDIRVEVYENNINIVIWTLKEISIYKA